jgi:hypothetical protein
MTTNRNQTDPADPRRAHLEVPDAEAEERLSEHMLEDTPEGRGPSKKIVRSELPIVFILAALAFVGLVAITLASRPSYSTVLTIAIIGLAYVVASPVLIAFMLRKRDEVKAHERAHEMVEGTSNHRGRIRRRAFYWSDSST